MCVPTTTTTTTKISAPGRLQNVDFPPPALLVYETHNEGRLGKNMLITLATKDTEETLRDAQSCAPGRFENFLRDGGQHGVMYHGKGLDFVATATFKA